MWIDFFNYEYCIVADTLFIKGLSEDASRRPSFAVPIGSLPLADAVAAVRAYCSSRGVEPLFSAVPVPDPDVKMQRVALEGDIPSPVNPPKGCKFHTRCPRAMEICSHIAPVYKEYEPGHFAACHCYPQE